ncbi:hypothetical protein FC19_GL001032 [Liquorilactobacillus aquaticus DSM 21051]|uniref:Microbial-type PARG catalytic domain-containing protein n=1 Tax=Liquorilactobacillus aquaticus DSM 21051 TaxID=1423725 RepID=A0A0R2CWG9_9LACO|nr:hypothetical protein FC19_GL001032 [Liquorilactobacillus aquaticus DSM 21051]
MKIFAEESRHSNLDNTQKKILQEIGHHTMNLYQIEMDKIDQKSELIENMLSETPPLGNGGAEIKVLDENILYRIKKATGHEQRVGVLNFASPTIPGGRFLEGVNAQEQTLCRNSFLYPELLKYRSSYYLENKRFPHHYCYSAKMIFASHIKILHDETEKNFLKGERHVDILSIAAPNVTAMKEAQLVIDQHNVYDNLAKKILQILRQFKLAGDRILILGAFGCGVFGNDPYMVAKIFRSTLARTEFCGCFQTIYFDILDNSTNLVAFKRNLI